MTMAVQEPPSVQRGGDNQQNSQASGGVPARETLSQLLARILDQLSLSAWLPSAVLVAIAVVYGNLRTSNGDLEEAVAQVGSLSAIGLILLVLAVVLSTLLTQAFEFEAVRLFEGYWGYGPVSTRVANTLSGRVSKRREKLMARLEDRTDSAFSYARQQMLRRGIDPTLVDAVEATRVGASVKGMRADQLRNAGQINWRDFARPSDIRIIEALEREVDRYPALDRRVLPMKLGNTLRVHEEQIYIQGEGRLEGFVLRVFDELPVAVQIEHDQYRNRLDLYCSLCVVLFLAAIAAVPVLGPVGGDVAAAAAVASLLMLLLSYRAAVASAARYGSILLTIGELRRGASS
jgi:hypothetical protein